MDLQHLLAWAILITLFHRSVCKTRCKFYDDPRNGYVTCDSLFHLFCSPECHPGYRFAAKPAVVYMCGPVTGEWFTYPIGSGLPWPDCIPDDGNGLNNIHVELSKTRDEITRHITKTHNGIPSTHYGQAETDPEDRFHHLFDYIEKAQKAYEYREIIDRETQKLQNEGKNREVMNITQSLSNKQDRPYPTSSLMQPATSGISLNQAGYQAPNVFEKIGSTRLHSDAQLDLKYLTHSNKVKDGSRTPANVQGYLSETKTPVPELQVKPQIPPAKSWTPVHGPQVNSQTSPAKFWSPVQRLNINPQTSSAKSWSPVQGLNINPQTYSATALTAVHGLNGNKQTSSAKSWAPVQGPRANPLTSLDSFTKGSSQVVPGTQTSGTNNRNAQESPVFANKNLKKTNTLNQGSTFLLHMLNNGLNKDFGNLSAHVRNDRQVKNRASIPINNTGIDSPQLLKQNHTLGLDNQNFKQGNQNAVGNGLLSQIVPIVMSGASVLKSITSLLPKDVKPNIHNLSSKDMGNNLPENNLPGHNLPEHNSPEHNLPEHNLSGNNLSGHNLSGHNLSGKNLSGKNADTVVAGIDISKEGFSKISSTAMKDVYRAWLNKRVPQSSRLGSSERDSSGGKNIIRELFKSSKDSKILSSEKIEVKNASTLSRADVSKQPSAQPSLAVQPRTLLQTNRKENANQISQAKEHLFYFPVRKYSLSKFLNGTQQ